MMSEEQYGEEGEVVMVERRRLDNPIEEQKNSVCTFQIIAACIIGLSTFSGGVLEGYTSPAIPLLLKRNISVELNESTLNIVSIKIVNSTTDEILTTILPEVLIVNSSIASKDDFETTTPNPDFVTTDINNSKKDLFLNETTELTTVFPSDFETVNASFNFVGGNVMDVNANNSKIYDGNKAMKHFHEIVLNSTKISASGNVSAAGLIAASAHFSESPSVVDSIYKYDIQISEEEASWLGSLLVLGACVGACGSSWMISLGRKRAILYSAVPRSLGWVLIATATGVPMLYAGRFMTGISLGMVTSAGPVYISEMSSANIRGSLSCVIHLGVNGGIFFVTLLGTFMAWRGLAIVGVASVILYFFITLLWVPESPVWLLREGRQDEAKDALKMLRGGTRQAEAAVQALAVDVNCKETRVAWLQLAIVRCYFMPLGIVFLVTIVNRFSGYNAIIMYCSSFLHHAVPFVSPYYSAVAVTLVQFISTAVAVPFVDRIGRRILLLSSVGIMAISLVSVAVCDAVTASGAGGSVMALILMMTYISAYSVGVGPLTWVLLGEVFPIAARDQATAVVAVVNWLAAFVVTKTYFGLEETVGIALTCLLYGSVCIVGFFLIFLFVEETRGKTLGQIEAHFAYGKRTCGIGGGDPRHDVALFSILEEAGGGTEVPPHYSTFSPVNA